jgi:hypothetical protein
MNALNKLGMLGLLVFGIMSWPAPALSQTNMPPAKASPNKAAKKATDENKRRATPFHGSLGAIDKTAKTITVGQRTFQITSETRIFKAGKPALLESGIVGEPVSGSYRRGTEGKLIAASVYLGARGGAKKQESSKAEKSSAN